MQTLPEITTTYRPGIGTSSPWGRIQWTEPVEGVPGASAVSTAGHGGIWIAPELRPLMPKGWRTRAWFEEDCEAAIPLLFLGAKAPERFEQGEFDKILRATVRRYYPGIQLPEVSNG